MAAYKVISPRLTITFILLFSLLMMASLWLKSSIDGREEAKGQQYLQQQAKYFQRQINRALFAPYALATMLRNNGYSVDGFETVADDLIHSIGGITNLQLAPDGVVQHIYPIEGHEKAIGHDLLKDKRRREGAIAALESKAMILAGPFDLIQGGRAIIGRLPVFRTKDGKESFWGFTTVLISIDTLLQSVEFESLAERGLEYRIMSVRSEWAEPALVTESEGFKQIEGERFNRSEAIQQQIMLPGHSWKITAYFRDEISDYLWLVGSLLLNLLIASAISSLIYWYEKVQLRHKQTQEQLLHAQRISALGVLAGGIAHEFNNILASIKGHNQLAMLKLPDDSPVSEHLQIVEESVERGASLVKEIMIFSRSGEEHRKLVDLKAEIGKILSVSRATIPSTISIQESLADGLPKVFLDVQQIHQVVQNLLNNAYHAVEATGSSDGAITISLYQQDSGVTLSVADNGVGMSEELKQRVFEPFFTTKEVGKGTGLGMSVVHGILEEHDATISIDSEVGKGTTIRITFPIIDIPS